MRAEAASAGDADVFELGRFGHWATLARNGNGREHLALSDGWRRIRLDISGGTLSDARCVRFHYELSGFSGLEARLLTVRRLLTLWRRGRFVRALFPPMTGLPRRLEALRVADALAAGASYREIAIALFGEARVRAEWNGPSDFLLSRVRRRVAEARAMAEGPGARCSMVEPSPVLGQKHPHHEKLRRRQGKVDAEPQLRSAIECAAMQAQT